MLRYAEQVALPRLRGLAREQLEEMRDAGHRVLECERAFSAEEGNVVAALLAGCGEFYQWDHYPPGDVYDWQHHAQYYYHAHAPEHGSLWEEEHGHFHTFLRPNGIRPSMVDGSRIPDTAEDELVHLVAISMSHAGRAQRLFTTNRWVTGETWRPAGDAKGLLTRFRVEHASPSLGVNVWITNMLRLFRPAIEALLDARDVTVAEHQRRTGSDDVYEDRALEIASIMDISAEAQLAAVEAALK